MNKLIPGAVASVGVVSMMVAATLMSTTTTTCATGSENVSDVAFDTRQEALVSYLERGSLDLGLPGYDSTYAWGRLDVWGAHVVAYGDVNDDRAIDLQDALAVLDHFGEDGTNRYNRYDVLYGDGASAGVDLLDAMAVLSNFGLQSCMPVHGGFYA